MGPPQKLLLGFVEDKNIYPHIRGVKRKSKIALMEIDPGRDIPHKTIHRKIKALAKIYERQTMPTAKAARGTQKAQK